MKNLFSIIGLVVVAKKAFQLYCEYSEMKRKQEQSQEQKKEAASSS